jgi:hypothetical protein
MKQSARNYLNFDLIVQRSGDRYCAEVAASPCGAQGMMQFDRPATDEQTENMALRMSRGRRTTRRIDSQDVEQAKRFGGVLFTSLFKDDVLACLKRSQDDAERQSAGLRIRLRLTNCAELAALPWEFLYDRSVNQFLSLSPETSVVRHLDMPERIRPIAIASPLRVLVVIARPRDYPVLDVEDEFQKLQNAAAGLIDAGRVELIRLEQPTMGALHRFVSRESVHVLHFIGHGGYQASAEDGVLIFEDEEGRADLVSGQWLGTMLRGRGVNLAVLNACEGARTSATDPFSGVAQSLLQKGIPAVVAMQFEITDSAAIQFSKGFYEAVADGYPIDAAVSEARLAVVAGGNYLEWATPVLFMRAPDGRIFDITSTASRSQPQADPELLQKPTNGRLTVGPQPIFAGPAEIEPREEAQKLEAQRRADKEAAKLETQRQADEEAAKLETQRRADEEAAKLETQRRADEEAAKLETQRRADEEAAKLRAQRGTEEEFAMLQPQRRTEKKAAKREVRWAEKIKWSKQLWVALLVVPGIAAASWWPSHSYMATQSAPSQQVQLQNQRTIHTQSAPASHQVQLQNQRTITWYDDLERDTQAGAHTLRQTKQAIWIETKPNNDLSEFHEVGTLEVDGNRGTVLARVRNNAQTVKINDWLFVPDDNATGTQSDWLRYSNQGDKGPWSLFRQFF